MQVSISTNIFGSREFIFTLATEYNREFIMDCYVWTTNAGYIFGYL